MLMIGIMCLRPDMKVAEYGWAPGVYDVEGSDLESEQIALSKAVVLPEEIEILDYEEQPEARLPSQNLRPGGQ
jgi:hypothetical protein